MRNDTRIKYNHSLQKLAEINGVESVAHTFNVAPVPAQKMEDK
ncbi:capsid protein, partial [Acinetobacter baumannii]